HDTAYILYCIPCRGEAGQPVDTGLGCAVGGELRALIPAEGRGAAGEDDGSAAEGEHAADGVLDGQECAGEVDADGVVPGRQVQVGDLGVAAEELHPGIGDHHIGRPAGVGQVGERGLDAGLLGDV